MVSPQTPPHEGALEQPGPEAPPLAGTVLLILLWLGFWVAVLRTGFLLLAQRTIALHLMAPLSQPADWLLGLSELPELLGSRPVRSHLVHALVQLDRDYTAAKPDERWEDWYAERLAERVAG